MMIRQAAVADGGAIAEIYNHFISETDVSFETRPLSASEMEARLAHLLGSGPCFVAEVDGEVAGWCYAHEWKEREAYSRTLETTVYVAPAYQRRGIGRALMERLIGECRARGAVALIACITGGNEASIELHRRLGFTQVSHFKEVGIKFGRRLDVIDMELLVQ